MKQVAAILLLLPLTGCIADQKKQVAACEMTATQTYPGDTLTGLSPSARLAHLIQTCMRSAGYDFKCYEAPGLSGSWPCYEPSTRGGKWSYQVERWLEARFGD